MKTRNVLCSLVAMACMSPLSGCVAGSTESESVAAPAPETDTGDEGEHVGTAQSAVDVVKMIPSTMPFYSEFDSYENPNHYDWCAQGAFKVVYKYQTGNYISLKTIESLLNLKYKNNYTLCGSLRCSSDNQMLAIASGPSPYLNLPNSVMRYVSNVTDFFGKAKDGVNFNIPAIVGSYVQPYAPWGHYWVIVGYRDTGNVTTSQLYLRDVARATAQYAAYDQIISVPSFYHSYDTTHGKWYDANNLLYIKP